MIPHQIPGGRKTAKNWHAATSPTLAEAPIALHCIHLTGRPPPTKVHSWYDLWWVGRPWCSDNFGCAWGTRCTDWRGFAVPLPREKCIPANHLCCSMFPVLVCGDRLAAGARGHSLQITDTILWREFSNLNKGARLSSSLQTFPQRKEGLGRE